ncbi:MAG: hypothetical protein K8T25_06480 [Planctomycetia bacterium]|nr:hypothetical protein [Planctomycetia bacterium]
MADADKPLNENPANPPPPLDDLPASPAAALSPAVPLYAFPPAPIDYDRHVPRLTRHTPPLSIGFLLLWTAATAVMLGVLKTTGAIEPRVEALGAGLLVLLSAVCGWIGAGAVLILWHGARHTLWPLEPGEWLVLAPACLVAGTIGAALMALWNPVAAFAPALAGFDSAAVVYAIAASEIPNNSKGNFGWAPLMWVMAASILSPMCLVPIGALLLLFIPPLALTLLIRAVVKDYRGGPPRHWLHYSGVVLTGLLVGGATIAEVVGLAMVFFG